MLIRWLERLLNYLKRNKKSSLNYNKTETKDENKAEVLNMEKSERSNYCSNYEKRQNLNKSNQDKYQYQYQYEPIYANSYDRPHYHNYVEHTPVYKEEHIEYYPEVEIVEDVYYDNTVADIIEDIVIADVIEDVVDDVVDIVDDVFIDDSTW